MPRIPKTGSLPPYLHNTDPLELEDVPLQLALLTMEVAAMRQRFNRLHLLLTALANATQLEGLPVPPPLGSNVDHD